MKTFRSRRKKLNKTEASELAKRTIGRFGYVKFDETKPDEGRNVVCEIISIGDVREHGRGHGWRNAFNNAGIFFDD
jgi:hypothetical protein